MQEPLVNVAYMHKTMKRAGFSIVVEYNLDMHGDYSKLLTPSIKDQFEQLKGLSDADKFHIGLYKNIIYIKD
jgi:hypothetical protein